MLLVELVDKVFTIYLTSWMIAYTRDYMIEKWFTYAIPPFIIHSDVVTGVIFFPSNESNDV